MGSNSKKMILVVDDDPDFVEIISQLLEFSGYKVTAAYEGIRAIELAHKKTPDLILLDLQMPSGTGQTVLKSLRGKDETRDIPVIVMTGMQASLEGETRQLGAQGFIQKPYNKEVLLGQIETLLSS